MSALEAVIRNRRSIRKFTDQNVSANLLNQVLEAVKWAPSWKNTQCWEVVVVRNPEIKQALADIVSFKNPATQVVASAPVVLAMCGRRERAGYHEGTATTKFGDWFMFDLGLATQNLCLRAHDLGLGTVIVGAFDHDRANQILKMPAENDCVVLIPLGYPNQTPKVKQRKDVAEFTHQDTF